MPNEIKPEQVPDEVLKRFATWQFPKCSENLMRRMLADALNAWPGAGIDWCDEERVFALPLPPPPAGEK